jgi:hypothetical protein
LFYDDAEAEVEFHQQDLGVLRIKLYIHWLDLNILFHQPEIALSIKEQLNGELESLFPSRTRSCPAHGGP